MARRDETDPTTPTTLAELIEETTYTPGGSKAPCCLPAIDPVLRLKWGLALLGEKRGNEYLEWLQEKIKRNDQ